MDEEHWIFLDEEKKEGVQVVLIDACHCPGAVMFLFRGKMGTVLHTGDFRFSETMFNNEWLCPQEKRNYLMKGITVDVDYLHLDNTFANPEYDFPSREEAYTSLVKIVKSHIDHRIFLFSYSLGKEEVLLLLADDFKTKIVVDEERMLKVKLMDLRPELFTTDPNASKIHVKQIRELPSYDINTCNKEMPTIFIILTGWNDKYNKNLPFYFKVPYSSHSNYRELERFVKGVNPRKIIYNVHERNDTKKRHDFQTYLAREYERKGPLVQSTLATPLSRPPHAQLNMGIISTKMMMPVKSLLHPIVNSQKNSAAGVSSASSLIQAHSSEHVIVNAGYKNAVHEMSSRFDVNNRELNKRRFNDQYSHILNASKARGAKFTKQEVSLSCTPPFAEQFQSNIQSKNQADGKLNDLQQLLCSDSDSKSQRKDLQSSKNKGSQHDILILEDSSCNSRQSIGFAKDKPEIINLYSSSCSSSGGEPQIVQQLQQNFSKKRKFSDSFQDAQIHQSVKKRKKLERSSQSQEQESEAPNRIQQLALLQKSENAKKQKALQNGQVKNQETKPVQIQEKVQTVNPKVDQAYMKDLRQQLRMHQASLITQAKSSAKTN